MYTYFTLLCIIKYNTYIITQLGIFRDHFLRRGPLSHCHPYATKTPSRWWWAWWPKGCQNSHSKYFCLLLGHVRFSVCSGCLQSHQSRDVKKNILLNKTKCSPHWKQWYVFLNDNTYNIVHHHSQKNVKCSSSTKATTTLC